VDQAAAASDGFLVVVDVRLVADAEQHGEAMQQSACRTAFDGAGGGSGWASGSAAPVPAWTEASAKP
jgi:hypothetical protein